MMNKTSAPDWMFAYDCECGEPMCPVCDGDFYRDQQWDFEQMAQTFFPDGDVPPPF